MGQDLESIAKYFHTSHASIWDYVAILLIFLFFLITFFVAFREWRMSKRAQSLVKFKYGRPGRRSSGASRRKAPRIMIRFPITLTPTSEGSPLECEVLDLSSGGVRILAYEPDSPILLKQTFLITGENTPLESLGKIKLEVINISAGPRPDTPILHGRWKDLSGDTIRTLNKAIRQRLLRKRK